MAMALCTSEQSVASVPTLPKRGATLRRIAAVLRTHGIQTVRRWHATVLAKCDYLSKALEPR